MRRGMSYSEAKLLTAIVFIIFGFFLQKCSAQTEQFTFYFKPSESTLSVDAMNTIDSMIKEGYVIEGAYGITNSLPNVSRSLTNDSLGHERALAVQNYCDCYIPNMGQIVMNSNSARDRAVDIFFKKIDTIETTVTVSADTSVRIEDTVVTDSIDSDLFFAEDTFALDTIINPLPNTDSILQFDTIIVQPLEASQTTIEVTANNDECECVPTNTIQLWETYKSLQDDAKLVLKHHGMRSREYQDILDLATKTKICWEFSRGVRSTKAKRDAHCGNNGKTGQMSVNKKKKSRKGKCKKCKRLPFKYTRAGRSLKNLKDWWRFKVMDRYFPNRNC